MNDHSLTRIIKGHQLFREKYASKDSSSKFYTEQHPQQPKIMIIACCDSRVDPALLFQCDPGDLFVIRNVANIIPPYETDCGYHGTSAALEFGVRILQVNHIIILGHSKCGGIHALLNQDSVKNKDFIQHWVSIVDTDEKCCDSDTYAKQALHQSYKNCLSFPWIKEKLEKNEISIHRWFFDMDGGDIIQFCSQTNSFHPIQQDYLCLVANKA